MLPRGEFALRLDRDDDRSRSENDELRAVERPRDSDRDSLSRPAGLLLIFSVRELRPRKEPASGGERKLEVGVDDTGGSCDGPTLGTGTGALCGIDVSRADVVSSGDGVLDLEMSRETEGECSSLSSIPPTAFTTTAGALSPSVLRPVCTLAAPPSAYLTIP